METNLWTFTIEYEGGTYISQFANMSLIDAIQRYNATDPSGQGAIPVDEDYTRVRGVQSVFCLSGQSSKPKKLFSKNDGFIFGHAILTEKDMNV